MGLKNRFGSRNQLTESAKSQHLAGTGAWLENKGECPEFVLFGHFAAKPNAPENEQLIISRKSGELEHSRKSFERKVQKSYKMRLK